MKFDNLPKELIDLANKVEPARGESSNFPSLFVLGYARSGKSTLAQMLSEQFGFSRLYLDILRTYPKTSEPAVRNTFYKYLLTLHPYGLIAEGDNLIGENTSKSNIMSPVDFRESIKRLKAQSAEVIFIGNADSTVTEKAAAIQRYRENNVCWTTKASYNSQQIKNLAARSISYSQDLREISSTSDIRYLEIRPTHFEEDLEAASREVIDTLKTK